MKMTQEFKCRYLFVVAAVSFGIWRGSALAQSVSESPESTNLTLQRHSDFEVELVASEPLIEDPVAFDWGPDGKLYVVEMRDYPLGMDNKGKPGGRIVVLEDRDGDGRYDHSTVFLDDLLFPNGVMTWRNGVLVTCAPDIFYAEDTDGDGHADKREVLFTGFGEANPQHRVNGLRWGIDNWVYCANGDFAEERDDYESAASTDPAASGFSSSQAEDLRRLALDRGIKSLKTGAKFSIRNRDFRIKPELGLLEPQSGQAQFGRDRDDWGEWFGCNHHTPLWHFALDDYYLCRNPHINYPSVRVEMPPSVTYAVGTTGRGTGSQRNADGNAFTSACSVTIYRDELFGDGFEQNWFVCEPVHNLVHRELLVRDGTTFTSRRPADELNTEFLASSDPMFSPVSVRTGPDGALWVADMYRQVLEHPHWLPEDWETKVDVRAGQGKGRIYRVYPKKKQPRDWHRLSELDGAGLVAQFESPNGWTRDKAQQLLVERQDHSVVELLERQVTLSQSPLARLHALGTLDGLDSLRSNVLLHALKDSHAGVRRLAVRLCEAPSFRTPEVDNALAELASDADPSVRLQLGYSLGFCEARSCGTAIGRLLRENGADAYIVAAALSSLTPKNLPAVVTSVGSDVGAVPSKITLALLQSALGYQDTNSAAALVRNFVQSSNGQQCATGFGALADWLDTLEQSNTSLSQLMEHADPPLHRELSRLADVFAVARTIARDPEAVLNERVLAIGLLGRQPEKRSEDLATVTELLRPELLEELQLAAIVTLRHFSGAEVPEPLINGWTGFTPKLRSQALDVILSRPEWTDAVIDALSDGRILPHDVPIAFRQLLIERCSPKVRNRAAELLTDRVNPDRNRVVAAYETALQLKGDVDRGLRVFGKHCAVCHRLGIVGNSIGPELAMVRDKEPEWFLAALFDPSRAVDAKYLDYLVVTKDGESISGVLAEEGSTSIIMVGATGQRRTILRSNIDEMASVGKSLMPEGFESELKEQDVADVIEFLRYSAPPPKKLEFNSPTVIHPDNDGSLRLLARNCEVFGDEIKVWDKHDCLGWWNGLADEAVWTIELPNSGRYAVLLNSSCAESSAGNQFLLQIANSNLTGKVASSGGWDTYQQSKIGEVSLEPGVTRLRVRALGEIRAGTYLFDLKEIRLQPLSVEPNSH